MSEIDVSLVTGESTGIDVSLTSSSQTIGVNIENGGSGYVLPPATQNRLGGVIVGDNINVTSNGTISVPDASDSVKGVIEIATDEEASAGISETLAVNPKQLSTKQDALVSGTNIKTINNESLLGYGNIEISGSSGFLPFPESWPTSSSYTTKQFCDAVNSDSSAVVGMAYLGEVFFSDLSTVGLVNSEITVEIMAGTTSMDKVILLRMTSGNHAPYQWQYTYWNAGSNVSGWIGFQPELPSQGGNNGKFLTTNGSNLSWGNAPVMSVNSKTGTVSLSASDVGALPDNTHIPADPVQSNWDEENTESLAYIQNKPTIPAAQVNSDWNANSGVAEILNKPSLAAVATSGAYSDLTGTPTIPTVGNGTITIAQGGVSKGTFTVNQSGDTTINLDSGGGGTDLPDQTGHSGEFLTTNGTAASWGAAPVTSVNSKTGAVTLTASDVGALPDSTVIPAAQVNSDWDAVSGVAQILNKPTLGTAASASTTDFATSAQGLLADTAVQPGDLATVATSGNYNDLSNKPTIPTVNDATLTIQKNGTTVKTFTANASTNVTANITVPTDTSDLSNGAGFITGINSGDVTAALGYTPVNPSSLSAVATSGSYTDLSNTPSIPAAQVNSDWNAVSGVAQILNKPSLAAVATSGAYSDLTGTPTIPAAQVNSDWNATSGVAEILNKPTIPTVNDSTITITQGGVTKGSFTLNQSSGDTIALDAGGEPSPVGVNYGDMVGTVTINGSDVYYSNSANYLTYPGSLDFTGATSFELNFAWTGASGPYVIMGDIDGASKGIRVYGSLNDASNRKVARAILYLNGTAQNIIGTTEIQDNTKYYLRLSWNGSVYTLSLSTDGTTYNTEATLSSSYLPVSTTYAFKKGTGTAVLHMDGWEFKKNGYTIWTGMGALGLSYRVPKGHEVISYQAPTSLNDYTWYRKYADGWVEMGGVWTHPSPGTAYTDVNITLPVTMSDSNYTLVLSNTGSNTNAYAKSVSAKTTTGFTCVSGGDSSKQNGFDWYVTGIAA